MTVTAYATAAEISREYGFTSRHWIRLAAQGRIPGAYQPSGEGGRWVFERVAFRRWWESRRRQVVEWRPSTNEFRFGGAAPSVRGESPVEASKRRIAELLKSVCASDRDRRARPKRRPPE